MFAFIQDQAQSDCFQAGAQTIAPLVPQTSVTYVEKGQPQKQSLWWQFGRFELSCKHCASFEKLYVLLRNRCSIAIHENLSSFR